MNDRGKYGHHVGAALSAREQFNRLDEIVKKHAMFWMSVGQKYPTPELHAFLHDLWNPFYRMWLETSEKIIHNVDENTFHSFPLHAGDVITSPQAAVRAAAQDLSELRKLASQLGISVPDIGSAGPQGGQYGQVGYGTAVGEILHTPSNVENALDQLHREIMQFGQAVMAWSRQASLDVMRDPEIAKLYQATKQAFEDIERVPTKGAASNPFIRDPNTQQERIARVAKYHKLKANLDQAVLQHHGFPTWDRTTWQPFFNNWQLFHEEKKTIPWQTLPLSGTWDQIQDYWQKFLDTRRTAPF
jgi:hypothetical protein